MASAKRADETYEFGGGARLTKRQAQILELLAQGLRHKEIARRLHLRPQTVKNHVAAIYRKLGIHRRVDMIRLRIQN